MGNTLKRITLYLVAAAMLGALVLPVSITFADTTQKLNESLLDAVKKGDYFTVEHLLKQGADPNYTDPQGKTLVDYATAQYPKDCLIYLLNANANIQFADWLKAFMSDISMQDYYIKTPFTYKKNQHIQIVNTINYFGLNLPVIPNNNLLRLNGWSLNISQPDADHASVALLDKNSQILAEYSFAKNGVWKLHEMAVHGAAGSHSFFSRNWLENIFRGVRQCGPINSGLNYDPQSRLSTGQFMEMRGYSNPQITGEGKPEAAFASYTINESFFRLPAVELSIPGDRFRYAITVQATARELAEKIYEETGERIHIQGADAARRARNDTAYIVPKSDNLSELVCSGSGEPQPVFLFDEDSNF